MPLRTIEDQRREERDANRQPGQGASLFWVGLLVGVGFLAWIASQSVRLLPWAFFLLVIYGVLGAVGMLPLPDAALQWLQTIWPYGR